MTETTADTYGAFLGALGPTAGVVFRGQTHEYPTIVPSLYRKHPPFDAPGLANAAQTMYFDAYRIDEKFNEALEDEWRPIEYFDDEVVRWGDDHLAPLVGHGFGTARDFEEFTGVAYLYSFSNGEYALALLQHYGAPTPTLDVSYDPTVALWFATHQYAILPGSGLAQYERATTNGIVYAMAASDSQVIDLRRGDKLPIAGLRGQRQAGGLLLGATAANSDLSARVIRKIHVTPAAFDTGARPLSLLNQKYLFPPPTDDVFYAGLLRAKKSSEPEIRMLAAHIAEYSYPP